MAAVVVEGRSNIETDLCVRGPCFLMLGLDVCQCSDARWCKRCFIKVEGAVNLGIGREAWIDSRWA